MIDDLCILRTVREAFMFTVNLYNKVGVQRHPLKVRSEHMGLHGFHIVRQYAVKYVCNATV